MMETNDTAGKNMMTKLKESFSLKSFSSRRYHSSLICNSKSICMDMNLIEGKVLTSRTFSGSDLVERSSVNASGENQETSSWQNKNLQKSKIKNKSAESSKTMKKFPKSENVKHFVKIGNAPKSSSVAGKSKLKTSVKHLYQAKNRGSVYRIETKAKQNRSEYESFRCDICMKYFSSKRGVTRHRVLHSSERHPCETCSKVFRTRDSLKRHWHVAHEVKVKSLQCTKCLKAYSRKSCLNRHLKNHPDHVQLSISPNDEFILD